MTITIIRQLQSRLCSVGEHEKPRAAPGRKAHDAGGATRTQRGGPRDTKRREKHGWRHQRLAGHSRALGFILAGLKGVKKP